MVATQNTEWGFFGTFRRNWTASKKETQAAWVVAVKALTAAGYTEEEARVVLDGRLGRHMADQIDNRRKVAETMADLVTRWAKDVANDAGRNPAAEKLAAEKAKAAKAKMERTTGLHRKAALAYGKAVDGGNQELINRRDRELRRTAIALAEAIREAL